MTAFPGFVLYVKTFGTNSCGYKWGQRTPTIVFRVASYALAIVLMPLFLCKLI